MAPHTGHFGAMVMDTMNSLKLPPREGMVATLKPVDRPEYIQGCDWMSGLSTPRMGPANGVDQGEKDWRSIPVEAMELETMDVAAD